MTKFNRTCFLLWRFSVFGILISIPGNLVGQDENTYLVETTQTAPLQIFESGTLQTLAKIPAGTDLKVLRERKGWYLVIDPATGHKGWIDGEFTTRNSDSSKKSRDPITIDSYPSNLFITNQNDVPVFVGKELIGKIEKHKIVWVFGLKDKWFYVKLPGSAKRGWVESKYLAVRRMEPKIRRQQEAAAEKAAIEVRNLSRDKKYLEALAKAKESVNLHIPLHGEEHPITIRENVAVGWLMIKTGQRQAGREHLSRWIEVEEGLQGVDSPGLITTYRLAGRFALDVSDEFAGVFYDKIFRVIDKQHASDLQQRTHKRREEVVQLHQARATQLALKYALKNLAKIKSTNFRGTDLEALELTNIGAFSQSLNQLDSAEEYFLRALAIPADKMSDQLRGNIHSRLGELYQQQRRHKNADQNFGLAAKYIQTGYGENHALTANALFEHGWNKYYLTDYQGAVEQLTKSLATYHKVSPPQPMKMAKVHVQLGYVYTMSGSASKAVSQFRRGVEMVEAAGYKDKVEASSYYQGLGFGLDVIGDPEAEKYLKKSVLLHEKSNSPPSRSKAESLRRYASFLLYRGQYDRAERYFLKATEITSKFPSLESYDAMNLHALASIAEHRKNYPRATRLANQALGKLLATHASDHQSVLQIRYRLANLQLLQGDIAAAERAYSKLAPLAKEKLGPHPHTIQTYTQWAKASTGASQLKRLSESRKLAFQYVNNELPLLPPYQQIGFLNQRYKTEFYDAIGLALTTNVDAVRVNESFEWLINGKAVSHESLGRYYRQVSGKSRPKAVPWRRRGELQNRIAPNLAYIDILKVRLSRNGSHQKATHYVAYVLTADELKFVDLGLANFIDDQVVRARETVVETATAIAAEGEQEATNKCNDVLSILSRELWNKLDIGPNISKLTISPDSNLWLLPWSALPLDANGRTLIEGYDINFVVTGRDLFAESEGKPADPSAIIADPNFGRVSSTATTVRPSETLRNN